MWILASIILIILTAASFSFAQNNEKIDSRLLAKAETEISTVRDFVANRRDSSDISSLVRNGFGPANNHDLSYESPSLKAEDIPLVMSSGDKKTMSVVMPPFMYFKQEF